jgi:hypothetical protein
METLGEIIFRIFPDFQRPWEFHVGAIKIDQIHQFWGQPSKSTSPIKNDQFHQKPSVPSKMINPIKNHHCHQKSVTRVTL